METFENKMLSYINIILLPISIVLWLISYILSKLIQEIYGGWRMGKFKK